MPPFYGWSSTGSRPEPFWGGSLLFTTKFLVLILSTSEKWKAKSTLETPSGFEHEALGLGILPFNHYAIAVHILSNISRTEDNQIMKFG